MLSGAIMCSGGPTDLIIVTKSGIQTFKRERDMDRDGDSIRKSGGPASRVKIHIIH
ncbi:hypothetical protein Tdes44962_MAKER10270 [Teratosphaeria destructans]|uniref:Uncharacterized protein n=1 Tax=Teratosphaeria destructans TaxID=418781 RepID=A0A9W7SLR7_9PEZI|nr:hypothetical protein Tdes44962_MAKER10270 [Teratosphaeria destructans]